MYESTHVSTTTDRPVGVASGAVVVEVADLGDAVHPGGVARDDVGDVFGDPAAVAELKDAIRTADYVVDIGPGAGIHGGHIIAANHPEGGAVFTVELPAVPSSGR